MPGRTGPREDIGGFNANADTAFELQRQGRTIVRKSMDSTDWSYQLAGGLEFQLTRNIWTQVGWRYVKYDFQKNGFTDDNALNGLSTDRDKFLSTYGSRNLALSRFS